MFICEARASPSGVGFAKRPIYSASPYSTPIRYEIGKARVPPFKDESRARVRVAP